MKKLTPRFYLSAILISLSILSYSQGLNHLEKYTLDNGLTVILNEDHTKAEVFGYMVCKAGAKDDPEDATGMAHYMEHMMFKGTSQLGTMNWQKEKPHIDSIFLLYDQLALTTDEDERKAIQLQINNQSIKANEFAIPNEFSNIVKKMGGTGLNANTSPDRTVYFNTFPPNQIEPWLDLYSHRFQDAVFRGFQSELEVVYEEKNMYADMFFMNMLEAFQKNYFKVHPYGQQNMIGTVDDLKNPSLTKMYEFYKNWYVPNNMALVLCGDFNADQVKPMIENAFGSWKANETPAKRTWEEKPLNGRELVEVKMSPVKIGILGFQTVPEGHPDEITLKICNSILSSENGSGLLDQLALNNELLAAQLMTIPYYDYSVTVAFFVPKIVGQSLEEAERLVLDQIKLVKVGDFDEWRVEAVKKELYRLHQEDMETNEYRGILLGEIFAQEGDIKNLKTFPDRIKSITKSDIIKIANKYYGENYLAFFSKMGSTKGEKIDKPEFKPVVSNTNSKSTFAKKLETIPLLDYTPKYIDFETDINNVDLKQGVSLYTTHNPLNDIFSLQIKFKAGQQEIPMLKYVTQITDMTYTTSFSKEELKNEIAKIGASYYLFSDESYTTLEVYGIESELDNVLILINGLINDPQLEQTDVEIIYENEKANRKVERAEPDEVASAAVDHIRYGNQSNYLSRLTMKEIKELQADSLIATLNKATHYEVELHYAGKKSITEVAKSINKNLSFHENLIPNDVPVYKPIQNFSENTVYFIHKKKAIQSKVFFLANGDPIDVSDIPRAQAFNQYFGGGFSGLVLQEIREYRSLAYSAGASYRLPNKINKPAYFIGYVGTQADKTNEAIDVFMNLTRNMPDKKERMDYIRPYLEQSAISNRPDFRGLSTHILNLKNKGIDKDPALLFKQEYQNIQFGEVERFYSQHVKNKPVVITIVGNKKKLDYKGLSKYGTIVDVKEKSLYKD